MMKNLKKQEEEISFATNPEAALAQYHEQGYFIEPNVLTHEECDTIIETAMEHCPNEEYGPWMMPHRAHEAFLKTLRNKEITGIIGQLVGGTPWGLQTEYFYMKPGTRGFSAHQDNFFVEAPLGVFASAWCALTDTSPENGGLIVYPESHKAGNLPVRHIELGEDQGQDPNANSEEVIIPPEYKPISAYVPKGSVLFIHGNVIHSSHTNQSDGFRHVLLCTYIKKGEKFREGRYAKREGVDV